jgi:hypothetical protein
VQLKRPISTLSSCLEHGAGEKIEVGLFFFMGGFMNPKYKFKGLFIPVELLSFYGLSFLEKMILIEIEWLFDDERGGCWATNDYLSKLLSVGSRWIREKISELIEKGYLKNVSSKPDERILVINKLNCFWTVRGEEQSFQGGRNNRSRPLHLL